MHDVSHGCVLIGGSHNALQHEAFMWLSLLLRYICGFLISVFNFKTFRLLLPGLHFQNVCTIKLGLQCFWETQPWS